MQKADDEKARQLSGLKLDFVSATSKLKAAEKGASDLKKQLKLAMSEDTEAKRRHMDKLIGLKAKREQQEHEKEERRKAHTERFEQEREKADLKEKGKTKDVSRQNN